MKLKIPKRIPEHEETMEGKDAREYFKAHTKKKRKEIAYKVTISSLFSKIRLSGGTVLDFGCGYGGLVNELSKKNKSLKFTGIDNSKTMIKLAKEHNKKINARFYVMDASDLKFDNETFELVICKDTFHHFKNPKKVLKEMIRVTKKNGFIFISDLRRDMDEEIFYKTIQRLAEVNLTNTSQYHDSVLASYTPKEMKKLLKDLNVKNFVVETMKIKHFPQRAKDYITEHQIILIKV